MKTLITCSVSLFLSLSAQANEIQLSSGSSALVRAGQEIRVTCEDSGQRRDRCECVKSKTCRGSQFTLMVEGVPVWESDCNIHSNGDAYYGNLCMEKKRARTDCQ
jgi:hypothetical protein